MRVVPSARASLAASVAHAVRAVFTARGLLAAAVLGAVLGAVLCPSAEARPQLTVSAAASLSDAFREIKALYLKEHPGTDIALNLAASGQLRLQIERGAPVDVFAAAGAAPMEALVAGGSVDGRDVAIFARNRLVLIVPAAHEGPPMRRLSDLAGPAVKRIAIGNESTVPAGQYAAEALRRAGLHERIADRLVPAENVRQVLEYVAVGAVDAGFVYASDLRPPRPVRVAVEVPDSLHAPIVYPIAPVRTGENPREAQRFVRFVLGSEARAVLASYGFLPPAEGDR